MQICEDKASSCRIFFAILPCRKGCDKNITPPIAYGCYAVTNVLPFTTYSCLVGKFLLVYPFIVISIMRYWLIGANNCLRHTSHRLTGSNFSQIVQVAHGEF